ncbi:ABC transporter permease [Rhodococcus erythropolis]|uniref:ABC transporter permease n=1 Tax=Rhodococcus erythropolis TaxID=1833 RepID=A0A0C2WI94_RHOER|nr:ABC transporter permease [Rhodococcus erythropolis]KIM17527.1 ABC transporter permease [Rhodococcus erythropolis]
MVVRSSAKRAAGAVFVLWAVASLSFFSIRAIPGDPVDAILGGADSNATAQTRQLTVEQYQLDRPLAIQYLNYLGRLLHGDLGQSYQLKIPVWEVISSHLVSTLTLAAAALSLAWVFALVVAIWSARGGRVAAAISSSLEIVSSAVPHFWLGTLLIVLFSVQLRWLPATSGSTGPTGLVLPVLTLAIPLAGFLGQVMRESMSDAMQSPFSLSARARGESEVGVSMRHAIRHAALPGIGLSGWAFGSLISGAVVVETIYSRPGLGRSLLQAVLARDVPVVLGITLVVALAYIVVTLLTDVVDRVVDPRLRAP